MKNSHAAQIHSSQKHEIIDRLNLSAPGERLNKTQSEELFNLALFHHSGEYANALKESRYGQDVFYNINRHINYSNICWYACRFCAFSAREHDKNAWTLQREEVLVMAEKALQQNATEFHIVGGAHPNLPLSYYEDILRDIKQLNPGIHLKAFSAVEIHYFAERFGMPVATVLERLKAAGLDSLPGGGAEIFENSVRERICPHKANAEQWLETHRQAHGMGLKSNATILYGHIETPADRVDHLLKLRDLQDETGGFQTIVPLKFHPENTSMDHLPLSGGLLDMQMIAACRIILDNFPHVKAYWPSLGIKSAQLALSWGADDFDGTVINENIYQMAGAKAPKGLTIDIIRSLIEEAGRAPVERDSRYNIRSV